jgi:short-subunit dehydrogenase
LQAELKNKSVVVVAAMPIQVDTAMGDGMPDPKVQPAEAASDALDAVESGQEIVFPGELSRGAAATFDTDPKGIQAYLASLVHEFL